MERNPRNILVSAIACSPVLGSEDGVGWNWSLELSKLGNSVTVLTRKRFRTDIEDYLKKEPNPGLSFHYIDLLPGIDYTGSPSLLSYMYIYVWQLLAFFKAKKLVSKASFDLVHHVTFAGIRLPSFLGYLGLPFVFGPVGGGEEVPAQLIKTFPTKARLKENLRRLSNKLVRYDPLMWLTMRSATVIGIATKDCLSLIPHAYHNKVVISSTIGVNACLSEYNQRNNTDTIVLYAGRFLHWKGMHIGLKAFAVAAKKNPAMRLLMVGDGPAAEHWRAIASSSDIEDFVTWVSWAKKAELDELYKTSDLFMFPSFHDSGGMVVLEAALQGLPTLCLDVGGPGMMVNESTGVKVAINGLGEDELVDALANSLLALTANKERLAHLGRSAKSWSSSQGWGARVRNFYFSCGPILAKSAPMPIDRHLKIG
tara:strand:- start:2382 stop:3656 length:1275 start_codon:yes stop_codon:yes gene_type:complete